MGAYPADSLENYYNYAALCDLTYIEDLDVFDSAFPWHVLENMTTLQRLAIVQNGFGDEDMYVFGKLHDLRNLSLNLNEITDIGAPTCTISLSLIFRGTLSLTKPFPN